MRFLYKGWSDDSSWLNRRRGIDRELAPFIVLLLQELYLKGIQKLRLRIVVVGLAVVDRDQEPPPQDAIKRLTELGSKKEDRGGEKRDVVSSCTGAREDAL